MSSRSPTPRSLLLVCILFTALTQLVRCSGAPHGGGEEAMPPVPAADRESWDCVIEIGGRGNQVSIRAPYLQDFTERQQTHADSGADMTLADSTGAIITRLVTRRLVVDHRENRLHAGGGDVWLTADDSLELRADSLVWDGSAERIDIPGRAMLVDGESHFSVSRLTADAGLDSWVADSVHASIRGHKADGGDFELYLEAQRDSTIRKAGNMVAHYDGVSAEVGEHFQISGRWAIWTQNGSHLSFAGEVAARDSSGRWIEADDLGYDVASDRRLALGAVRLRVDADTELRAHHLEEEGDSGWLALGEGPDDLEGVTLTVGDRSFAAMALRYAAASGTYVASIATFARCEQLVKADTLIYAREADYLEGRGGVQLSLPEMGGQASGLATSYDLRSQQAQLSGTFQEPAALARHREADDSLFIEAAVLHFEFADSLLRGEGDFEVRAADISVEAGAGRFDSESERLELEGGVTFRQSLDGGNGEESRLETPTMELELDDGRISLVILPAGVEGLIRGAGQQSWLKAGSGSVSFANESLSRMELAESAEVTHRGPGSVNRFTAQAMKLFFDVRGALERVAASGDAALVSRVEEEASSANTTKALEEGSGGGGEPYHSGAEGDPGAAVRNTVQGGRSFNRVSGESLHILFEEGKVVEVEVTESIEGRYFTEKEIPQNGDAQER